MHKINLQSLHKHQENISTQSASPRQPPANTQQVSEADDNIRVDNQHQRPSMPSKHFTKYDNSSIYQIEMATDDLKSGKSSPFRPCSQVTMNIDTSRRSCDGSYHRDVRVKSYTPFQSDIIKAVNSLQVNMRQLLHMQNMHHQMLANIASGTTYNVKSASTIANDDKENAFLNYLSSMLQYHGKRIDVKMTEMLQLQNQKLTPN